jgi:hypothetical protein
MGSVLYAIQWSCLEILEYPYLNFTQGYGYKVISNIANSNLVVVTLGTVILQYLEMATHTPFLLQELLLINILLYLDNAVLQREM